MKIKRAKQYKKLMHHFRHLGFREPYQVLLDSQILEDAYRTKIDLVSRLEGVLQGKVKPMVTQCDMRRLYSSKNSQLIELAKKFERRRCGHHELDEPLSSLECISSVVDPKENQTNKHRLIVASQDLRVRARMRTIAGCPLIYINKSVMIMEPMNTATEEQREQEERNKFRLGLKGQRNPAPPKRKRDNEDSADDGDNIEGQATEDARPQKKKKRKGPKEPNPLSIKKPKKETPSEGNTKPRSADAKPSHSAAVESNDATAEVEGSGHRKRKRKHKPKGDGEGDSAANVDGEAVVA
ncbi:hypothetical protein BU23DRAFT_552717 [Bimuria novae-zelandiae CBS 107.79]|uniref:U three protein 23 n=1 Tax=Bimuria novae-zelandiae CBS 107.79 TaxID=1447943 RepID=A0A6A5VCW9_9PLEO|nr:hypothetical protein BU23DRAFT_552717 [Bimuria novae-zelandiae CBS 107.79]